MNTSVQEITLIRLVLAFLPAVAVLVILQRWSLGVKTSLYALARMAIQLLLVGYVLAFIFEADRALIVIAVLTMMLGVASWISLRPLRHRRRGLLLRALVSIALGGGVTLAVMTQAVLALEPWFWPRYMVPLAGMAFANAMNSLSLAAERFEAETDRGASYCDARQTAFRAALIPVVNSLFATGLVSLPGMMTGQILSGVSPLVAARYQMMIMAMVFGAAGLASSCYLFLLDDRKSQCNPSPTKL
jgi:putative ABC transport system permease protein